MNKLMMEGRFLINTSVKGLDKLSYSLQTQCYTIKGEPEKFTEHTKGSIDDWNDASGYFVSRKFGIFNAQIGMKKMKKR